MNLNKMVDRRFLSFIAWVSFCLALLLAVRNPASGYEESIYQGTPISYWLFIGVAATTGLHLLMWGYPDNAVVEYSILPLSVLSITSLPILRRYYFFGVEDPMTHLGWTMDMMHGDLSPLEIFYPAIHLMALTLSKITGLPPRTMLLIVVVAMIAVWLLSVPLLVQRLTAFEDAYRYGIVVACILLPLNPFNVFVRAHPTSQGIFFLPILLLTIFLLWRDSLPRLEGAIMALVLAAGAIAIHPLVGAALALMLISAAIGEALLYRSRAQNHVTLAGLGVAIGVLTLAAMFQMTRFTLAVNTTLVGFLSGSGGTEIASRTSSLGRLGVSISSFALRVGGKYPPVLPFGLVGLLAWYRSRASRFIGPLTAATLPIGIGFLAFLAAGKAGLWGRFIGLAMVPGTIVVGVGVAWLHAGDKRTWKVASTIALATAITLSMATVFVSPYVLLPNHQVTEASVDGAQSYYSNTNDGAVMYVRVDPGRLEHAGFGVVGGPFSGRNSLQSSRVPDHFAMQNLSGTEGPSKLLIWEFDYMNEVELYKGTRYNSSDFLYLRSTKDVHKIHDGGITIYEIRFG